MKPEEHEEVLQALEDAAVVKFRHGKRWGCNRKQRNLKRRGEVCMEVVSGKCTDNESLKRIMQTDEIMDECASELEKMQNVKACWTKLIIGWEKETRHSGS